MGFLKSNLKSHVHDDHIDNNFNSENELIILSSWLYLGYKNVLSSQDGGNCTYYPSCSTYAIRAIQKKGTIVGLMAGFDRLTRCHPFAVKHYPIYIDKKVLYDPVEDKSTEVSKDQLQYLPDF